MFLPVLKEFLKNAVDSFVIKEW